MFCHPHAVVIPRWVLRIPCPPYTGMARRVFILQQEFTAPVGHIALAGECWTFCRLRTALVPWQVPRITLHSNAGVVKWPFAPHKQSPAVARLATVCTTAALEGPVQVGPTNFWKSPLRGLYVSVMIVLQCSMTYRYELTYRCV